MSRKRGIQRTEAQERGLLQTWGFVVELSPSPPKFIQNNRYKYTELCLRKKGGGKVILAIKNSKIQVADYGELLPEDKLVIDKAVHTYNGILQQKGEVQITALNLSESEWELSGHGERLDDWKMTPSKGGRTALLPRMQVEPHIRGMLDEIVIPQRGPYARIDEDPVWGIEGFPDVITLITPGLVAAITTANLPDLLGSSSWDRSQFDLWFMACVLYAWSREDKSDWPSNLSIARIARLLEPRVKDGVFDFEGMTLEDWKQYLWEATSRR